MRWVPDQTGRFIHRPHYETSELDFECEQIIRGFLLDRYGRIEYPVNTDDFACLIERDAADLDLYADLSQEDGDVEGVTEFYRGRKPDVKISHHLSEDARLENRLRTTLTHEYGHVHFHHFMFEVEVKPPSLFGEDTSTVMAHANRCKRDGMMDAHKRDWMEWQAGYVCGALLMPASTLTEIVDQFRLENRLELKLISAQSEMAQRLIRIVASTFQVSQDAARMRLLKRKALL